MDAVPSNFSVFRGGHGVAKVFGPNVVAFGKFDGVHLGHRALVARAAQSARRLGWPYGVATFERHPYTYLRRGNVPPALTGLGEKLRLFREVGVRFVVLFAADSSVLGVPAEEFARNVLRGRLGTKVVVVGQNFQFGRGGAGGISTIRGLVAATGLDGVEAATVEVAGRPVSATRIRNCLAEGDITLANKLLGRPYEVLGRVVGIASASASILVPVSRAVPAPGSYPATIRLPRSTETVLVEQRRSANGQRRPAPSHRSVDRDRLP